MQDPIVIIGAARTPIGGFQGELAAMTASELGGIAIKAAMDRAGVDPASIDEVHMGCVLPAGQGQAPARQAAHHAGIPWAAPCNTLNKMCGSGMRAVMLAADQFRAGNGGMIVAGGMESMTNAPYLLPKLRSGARLGHSAAIDHMFLDGLEDAFDPGRLMGTFAEDCAEKYQFSRAEQDDYALGSLEGALNAQNKGYFTAEMASVTVKSRKGDETIESDEQPRKARPEKIPQLKPAFRENGTVTAANASSISDGASALILMRQSDAKAQGLPIRARIVAQASHAQQPGWFTTAPVPAAQKALEKAGLVLDDIDLFEVNEAFAVVPMAFMRELGVARSKMNIHGGACALGHPIGASGARILVTLLHALESHDKKRGLAAICIGGGEGTAMVLERG